jgi:hypothetical protein
MLDVHPPHGSTHTWRDFFIHIATICIGLLIAIGLEQTVEFFHHRHQLHQLEADLHDEGVRNLHITLDNIKVCEERQQADALQYAEFLEAAHDHRAPAVIHAPYVYYNRPAYAVWTVAQENGTAGLLPREDAQRYARLYGIAQYAVDQVKPINSAIDGRLETMLPAMDSAQVKSTLLRFGQPADFDLSRLSPEDLRAARNAVAEDVATTRQSIKWSVYLYSIEWTVLHGSRSDEQNARVVFDAMQIYGQGGVPALLAKYPILE